MAGRIRLVGRGGLLAVLAPEPLDAAGRIHQFLLAGEKRMAVRADFDVDLLPGGPRVIRGPAGARDRAGHVVGMNALFHTTAPFVYGERCTVDGFPSIGNREP